MKRPDWFLVAIVVGVAVLVIGSLVLAARQPEPTYRADGTPEGVAHDYLLALADADYARAWGYLSPDIPGYPTTVEQFVDDVADQRWTFALDEPGRTFTVGAATAAGDRRVVEVEEATFRQEGLFDSGQFTRSFAVTLTRDGDAWRIWDSERYWHRCWAQPPPCDRFSDPDDSED